MGENKSKPVKEKEHTSGSSADLKNKHTSGSSADLKNKHTSGSSADLKNKNPSAGSADLKNKNLLSEILRRAREIGDAELQDDIDKFNQDLLFKILRRAREIGDAELQDDIDKFNQGVTTHVAQQEKGRASAHAKRIEEKKRKKCLALDPFSSDATRKFLECLKQKLEERKIQMDVVQSFDKTTADEDTFLLVCNNVSRLGADIENTLSQVKGHVCNQMVILVLHCTTESNLPAVSAKTLLSGYRDMDIVDVAFNTEKGDIYNCDMNNRAFEALQRHFPQDKSFNGKEPGANNTEDFSPNQCQADLY